MQPRPAIPVFKISLALTSLCVSVAFIACAVGLMPDRPGAIVQGRANLCEALAIQCTTAAHREDLESIRVNLQAVAQRNPELLSLALRKQDGVILVSVGDHAASWVGADPSISTPTHIRVPIQFDDAPWGEVEVAFTPITSGIWFFLPKDAPGSFILFLAVACFLVNWGYLRAMFRSSGPTGAVPNRVRSAMNTLAEGVLILDNQQRIALANDAFADMIGQSPDQLQGKTVNDLPWFQQGDEDKPISFPWDASVSGGVEQTGVVLGLQSGQRVPHSLSVNAAPIVGEDGSRRGAIATFDNLTPLERKNAQLRKVLLRLRQSRAVVRHQNHELKALATKDPLTGCFNRRTLFAELERLWESSQRYQHALSVIMVDVDHFKSVNDRFGHSVGDEVLKQVSEVLRMTARKTDVVCRYGGEEFCVLLPHIDIEEGMQAGERLRQAIAAKKCANVAVTASFGVSSISLGAPSVEVMLEQADQALYASKRLGRNRVTRFDEAPKNLLEEKGQNKKVELRKEEASNTEIPFHAVAALLSALAYRDQETAEHSRRVADLCVRMGVELMSQRECYVLEVAALLHDIGKLGVPDAVLFKPGTLTPEEWKIIRAHEAIGLDILRAAFTSDDLTRIIRAYHFWYGGGATDGSADSSSFYQGEKIPLSARILAIADAFDSMVSDRVYRKVRTHEQAFEELRRCATSQFDPALVERFVEMIQRHERDRQTAPMPMSKKTALQIGLQIEKLASAADGQDIVTIAQMAAELRDTAKEHGITQIAEVAGQLEKTAAAGNASKMSLVKLTIDLLELCRSTQRTFLPSGTIRIPSRLRKAAEAAVSEPRDPTPTSPS